MATVAKCLGYLEGPGIVRVWDVRDTFADRKVAEEMTVKTRQIILDSGYRLTGEPADKDPVQYGLACAVVYCLGEDRENFNDYLLALYLLRGDPLFAIKGAFTADGVAATYRAVPTIEAFDTTVALAESKKPTPTDGGHRLIF